MNVRQFQRGISWCLDKDEACWLVKSIRQRLFIRGVNEFCLHTKGRQHLLKQAHGASVNCLGDDDTIARAKQSQTDGGCRCHAGCVASTELRPLKGRQPSFKRGDGGITGSTVGESLVLTYGLLSISCSLVDRREHRAGRRIGISPGVQGERIEVVVTSAEVSFVEVSC